MAEVSTFARVWGSPLTTTSTTANYTLGAVRETTDSTYGFQRWVYIRNTSGSALAVGLGVAFKDGYSDHAQTSLSTTTSSRARFIGVAQHAIPNDSYGWILAHGRGQVAASAANISANASLKPVANGLFTDGVIGTNDLVGFSGVAIASGATGEAFIKGQ